MTKPKEYKFIIIKDKEGNEMLTAFYGEIDKAAIKQAKQISPEDFAKALVMMVKQSK